MSGYPPVCNKPIASLDAHLSVPRIDLNLREHKFVIAIHWTILFTSSCIIPIVLYFALRYGAHLELSTVLAVTTAIFGVVTLFSISKRSWALLKTKSTCRPLGASKAALDYFHLNFLGGFVCVTAIIIAGNVTKNIRIVALGLPILLVDVCFQLLVVGLLRLCGASAPFRISSVNKGERIRSGVYAIAEDIVAVDGGLGQTYRRQLEARYVNSPTIQTLCLHLDILWGITGLVVAVICFTLIFSLHEPNVAYVMGWVIPWAFAGIMAWVTIRMTASAVEKENRVPTISC